MKGLKKAAGKIMGALKWIDYRTDIAPVILGHVMLDDDEYYGYMQAREEDGSLTFGLVKLSVAAAGMLAAWATVSAMVIMAPLP